jgi:hypothetical protein
VLRRLHSLASRAENGHAGPYATIPGMAAMQPQHAQQQGPGGRQPSATARGRGPSAEQEMAALVGGGARRGSGNSAAGVGRRSVGAGGGGGGGGGGAGGALPGVMMS